MASRETIRSFNRYELKYVVHLSQAAGIIADLLLQMTHDRHGDTSGSYNVTNLYYDSAQLHLLRSKIVGTNYRRKLRIRVYGDTLTNPATTAMTEIKQRLGRTTQKRRVVLPLEDALSLCEGVREVVRGDAADGPVADEIISLVHALQLRPVCTVSYRRRAFVGSRFESGLRVTFDTELWGGPPTADLCGPSPSSYLMPRDWSILEIKVDDRVPNWICELVAKHNCRLQRVSKYCLSMVRLNAMQVPLSGWAYSAELASVRTPFASEQLVPGE